MQGSANGALRAGIQRPDDAAVWDLDADQALIQTADFFTPIVDDPETFGAIAAANAMSDVFAMGGEVLFALNIAGMPDSVGLDVLSAILAGGARKVREAGGVVAGGHTVTNPELFYGLSVTGLGHPNRLLTKGESLDPGQTLWLTKPLGTGIVTTAHIVETHALIEPGDLEAAIQSMLTLNAAAAAAARTAGIRRGTDVTGFGLLGHACEMLGAATRSNCGLRIDAKSVPLLPNVLAYARNGVRTRAAQRNPEHFGQSVHFADTVAPEHRQILWEAETSGGLLLAVPPGCETTFENACRDAGQDCWQIGEVATGTGIEVT